eukprot:7223822-Prorocentrum_lima.AAC.1
MAADSGDTAKVLRTRLAHLVGGKKGKADAAVLLGVDIHVGRLHKGRGSLRIKRQAKTRQRLT